MGNAIEIHGVSKAFKRQGKKIEALHNIELQIPKGQIFGFLGPNGAGKTTLIKIMMGMLLPDSGSVSVMGNPPSEPHSRLKLGYFPERPYMHDFLTAEEFLKFHGRLLNMTDERIRVRTPEVLKIVGLDHATKLELKKFSKGMLQRIGLGQALLHDPDVLVLDEPMSGLDPLGRRDVRDLILGIAKLDKTVFFSTHIVSDIEAICSNVGFINKGLLKSIDDIEVALGKTIKSIEISFSMPTGKDPRQSAQLAQAQPSADAWFLNVSVNKGESIEAVDKRIHTLWSTITGLNGAVRSVIPRKADLEEFFFEGSNQ